MKRLALVLFVISGVAAGATVLQLSDRGKSFDRLIPVLNGSPVFVAAVSTDGGVAANTCTSPAGASDAGLGDFVMVQCTQEHWIRAGNCTTAATNTGVKVATDEKYYTLLQINEMAISALPTDAGVIGACRVYHLK